MRRLIDIDPERKADHLRQLAMSNLERGQPTEAREVLRKLAECENPTDAAEFEAGVLALAGLNEEAAATYRRGLAQHPERIDGFLLLGNALNGLHQTERAIGMFQFLAERICSSSLRRSPASAVLKKPPRGEPRRRSCSSVSRTASSR